MQQQQGRQQQQQHHQHQQPLRAEPPRVQPLSLSDLLRGPHQQPCGSLSALFAPSTTAAAASTLTATLPPLSGRQTLACWRLSPPPSRPLLARCTLPLHEGPRLQLDLRPPALPATWCAPPPSRLPPRPPPADWIRVPGGLLPAVAPRRRPRTAPAADARAGAAEPAAGEPAAGDADEARARPAPPQPHSRAKSAQQQQQQQQQQRDAVRGKAQARPFLTPQPRRPAAPHGPSTTPPGPTTAAAAQQALSAAQTRARELARGNADLERALERARRVARDEAARADTAEAAAREASAQHAVAAGGLRCENAELRAAVRRLQAGGRHAEVFEWYEAKLRASRAAAGGAEASVVTLGRALAAAELELAAAARRGALTAATAAAAAESADVLVVSPPLRAYGGCGSDDENDDGMGADESSCRTAGALRALRDNTKRLAARCAELEAAGAAAERRMLSLLQQRAEHDGAVARAERAEAELGAARAREQQAAARATAAEARAADVQARCDAALAAARAELKAQIDEVAGALAQLRRRQQQQHHQQHQQQQHVLDSRALDAELPKAELPAGAATASSTAPMAGHPAKGKTELGPAPLRVEVVACGSPGSSAGAGGSPVGSPLAALMAEIRTAVAPLAGRDSVRRVLLRSLVSSLNE